MKVAFLTLGCKVNYSETEKMMHQFVELGFSVVEFREKADIYVINTCTVTNMADRKSRQMIHRAKKINPDGYVVAVGCYVDSGKEELLKDPSIDACFSNKEKDHVAETIASRFFAMEDLKPVSSEKTEKNIPLVGERTRAYIKIQDGCNQFCTYCLIPYVRGRGTLYSVPEEEVVANVKELVQNGYKEIVLNGIHLSSYGVDWTDEKQFVSLEGRFLLELIEKLGQIPGVERIRLGSLEPRIITEQFLEGLCKVPQICPHFHLSLQSGCDRVLKSMNRHYTTGEYKEKLQMIRRFWDRPAITTDIIAGFPGESEEDFLETLSYVEQIRLADIHVFPYSQRSGTKAASMPGQIAPEVKKTRASQLIGVTQKLKEEYEESFLGQKVKVLFEEFVEQEGTRFLVGHTERYIKIAITETEAEKMGLNPNDIGEIIATRENILEFNA